MEGVCICVCGNMSERKNFVLSWLVYTVVVGVRLKPLVSGATTLPHNTPTTRSLLKDSNMYSYCDDQFSITRDSRTIHGPVQDFIKLGVSFKSRLSTLSSVSPNLLNGLHYIDPPPLGPKLSTPKWCCTELTGLLVTPCSLPKDRDLRRVRLWVLQFDHKTSEDLESPEKHLIFIYR